MAQKNKPGETEPKATKKTKEAVAKGGSRSPKSKSSADLVIER